MSSFQTITFLKDARIVMEYSPKLSKKQLRNIS